MPYLGPCAVFTVLVGSQMQTALPDQVTRLFPWVWRKHQSHGTYGFRRLVFPTSYPYGHYTIYQALNTCSFSEYLVDGFLKNLANKTIFRLHCFCKHI